MFARHLGLREERGARDLPRRRRLLRHQDPRLPGRDGDCVAAVEAAGAAGEVRRRPAESHSRATSTPATTASPRRMAVTRDGTILALEIDDLTGIGPYSVYPAHLRRRGQPGGQPVRRPVQHCDGYGPRSRGVPEQDADLPVPRRRPPDRDCAVTEGLVDLAARSRGHGPRRDPPPQPDAGRRLPPQAPSAACLRRAVASPVPGAAAGADGLPGAAGGAGAMRAPPGVYRGIGLATFIELTNPCALLLRRRRRADLARRTARPCGSTRWRRHACCPSVTEQGQGTEGDLAQIAADARRRRPRAGARRHGRHRRRRPMAVAPGPAAAPASAARRCCRRGTRAAREHPGDRRRHAAGRSPATLDMRAARWWTRDGASAHAARTNSAASSTSAATRCRRVAAAS